MDEHESPRRVTTNLASATGQEPTPHLRHDPQDVVENVQDGAAPIEVGGELVSCLTFKVLTTDAAVEASPHSDAARTLGILNSANHAFVGMDAAGRITDWNRQAETTFGWPSEEAIGRFLAETILVVEFRAGLTWFLPGGKDGMVNRRFESRAVDRHGREFPVELALWEVNGAGGSASFHALIHDISERRVAEDAMRLALSAALAAVAQMPRHSDSSRGRILVVDDYPVSQLVASAIIEQLGYQVDLANSGPEALTAIQFTHYDVILMDCVMPVMDGYEATSLIRRLEGPSRHTPIVALTAESMTGDREKCLAAGMDDYVSKPFDPAALSDALARCTSPV
jgi:PAS domain S-box-containing protein